MATPSEGRSGIKLERWQALLAAVVTAAAGIVVAVISARGSSSDKEQASTPSSTSSSPAYGVSIRGVTYQEGESAAFFLVNGNAVGVAAWDDIYVLARPAELPLDLDEESPAGDGSGWLVSERADRSESGSWETTLTIPRGNSTALRFVAVIYSGEGCPASETCAPDDPRPRLAVEGPAAFAPSVPLSVPAN